ELALRNLVLQLGLGSKKVGLVERVEIKMGMAVAPAWPQELVARFQDLETVVHLDPGIAGFAERAPRFSTLGVDEIEVKLVLGPVEHQGPPPPVAQPAEGGDVDILF